MTDAWVGLIQTGVWVLAAAVLLFVTRHRLRDLVDALVGRIVAGAEVGIGPINIGSPPAALRKQQEGSVTSEGAQGAELAQNIKKDLAEKRFPAGLDEEIYLVHSAQIVRARTARSPALYRIRLWVEAYEESLLDEISRVTYRLHDTFPQPVIATQARDKEFELWMNAVGEFTVIAHAERRGQAAVWMTRYLELPGRPPG